MNETFLKWDDDDDKDNDDDGGDDYIILWDIFFGSYIVWHWNSTCFLKTFIFFYLTDFHLGRRRFEEIGIARFVFVFVFGIFYI